MGLKFSKEKLKCLAQQWRAFAAQYRALGNAAEAAKWEEAYRAAESIIEKRAIKRAPTNERLRQRRMNKTNDAKRTEG